MQQSMELTDTQKKRFWDKVDKTDSCWLWTGSMNTYGYGQVKLNCKNYQAHRVSWFLIGSTIPEGHVIRHKCRDRKCVNPEHLETGTQAENMADMIRDGTSNIGEKNPCVKLTEAQVLEIRKRSTENQYRLAEEYGVARANISYIIHRRTWKHI